MTTETISSEESRLIQNLANQIQSMPQTTKHPGAEQLIQASIASQPDALYRLVQLTLIQDIALEQLKIQLETLKQAQLKSPDKPTEPRGFLDELKEKFFGSSAKVSDTASGVSSAQQTQQIFNRPVATGSGGANTSINPNLAQANPSGSATPGFLHGLVTVGAGVAGGMLLADAIRHFTASSGNTGTLAAVPENSATSDSGNLTDNSVMPADSVDQNTDLSDPFSSEWSSQDNDSDNTLDNNTFDNSDFDNNFDNSDSMGGDDNW